jgi:hypothetical protein
MRYRLIQKTIKSFDEFSKDVIGIKEKRNDKMVKCMIVPIHKEISQYIQKSLLNNLNQLNE